jgi:hypothetical protein
MPWVYYNFGKWKKCLEASVYLKNRQWNDDSGFFGELVSLYMLGRNGEALELISDILKSERNIFFRKDSGLFLSCALFILCINGIFDKAEYIIQNFRFDPERESPLSVMMSDLGKAVLRFHNRPDSANWLKVNKYINKWCSSALYNRFPERLIKDFRKWMRKAKKEIKS